MITQAKIISDADAKNYLDTVVRKKYQRFWRRLGDVVIENKISIGHHSDLDNNVIAWAWHMKGLRRIGSIRKAWRDRKLRWLVDNGEIINASYNDLRKKIIIAHPDLESFTEDDRQPIKNLLHKSE